MPSAYYKQIYFDRFLNTFLQTDFWTGFIYIPYIVLYYIYIYINTSNSNKGCDFVENHMKASNIFKKWCRENVACYKQEKEEL